MPIDYNAKLIPRAKDLRKNMTRHERHLWYDFLKSYPIPFQRQKTIKSFIADFYCYRAQLIIELDGSQHYSEQGLAYDSERDAILKACELEILRFSNRDIDEHFESVCKAIDMAVKERVVKFNKDGLR